MKTIDEIRRERLLLLKEELGGVGALANKLEKGPSQVSQWLNASAHSATGKGRGISDDACRDIEKKCDKPRGWMDSDPDKVDARLLLQIMSLYLQSTELGQEQILDAAKSAQKTLR